MSASVHAMTVRRHDRERFVTALFAPPERREDLFVLYAWNSEVARIRDTVKEPMLGQIRLQWWRDSLDKVWSGAGIGHAEMDALGEVALRLALPKALLDRLLEAREQDMRDAPFETEAQLARYVDDSAGILAELAARILGGSDEVSLEAARQVGRAWGLIGLMRAHAWRSESRRPLARLAEGKRLAEKAREHLRAARAQRGRIAPSILPALLPARLADGYLARLRRAAYDIEDKSWSAVRTRPLRLVLANSLGRF